MNVVVPAYIKNILKYCGYNDCHSIATIGDADVEHFTDQVRKGKVNNFYHGKINAEAIMEGCTSSVENFEFSRGHLQLLKVIVKMMKDTVDIHGVDGFLLKLPQAAPYVQNKENISKPVSCVYRKRFKFSSVTPTSAQDNIEMSSDESISPIQKARSTIIKKAVLSLITHTPQLFANVCCRCAL